MFLQPKKKKQCNVILSAGGIRAIAQIGALQAIEEAGYEVKSICGISAGAIVASFYASGSSLDEMARIAVNTDFLKFRKWNLSRLNEGMFKFEGLGKWVYENSINRGYKPRCELNIATCSMSTGNKRIFTNCFEEDMFIKTIEATCCIPVVFKPIKIDNEYYADGALWSAAPVHFYENSKLPTFVIHVQTSHTYIFTAFHRPIHTLYRVFEVFQINRLRSLKKRIKNKPVCIVEPQVGNISPLAFKSSVSSRRDMIELGRRSTKAEILKFIKR